MDNKITHKRIVCLGGGIGTVNLIAGLKHFTDTISVVVSGADDGGSAGRLRRLFDIFPPGDAVSCLSALLPESKKEYKKLLTYRFPGNRYAKEDLLAGHKVGNLLFVAAHAVTGSTNGALALLQNLFQVPGKILPATVEKVSLSARTADNITVDREENIDLGKYKGKRVLEEIFLSPPSPKVPTETKSAIDEADVLIAGPGDLYTTVLPVLIVPEIRDAVIASNAKKVFVVNVANKPFETNGYTVHDFIQAVVKHIGTFPFSSVVVNTNHSLPIPSDYKYHYVKYVHSSAENPSYEVIMEDLVDQSFPLYHDSTKLATAICKRI